MKLNYLLGDLAGCRPVGTYRFVGEDCNLLILELPFNFNLLKCNLIRRSLWTIVVGFENSGVNETV